MISTYLSYRRPKAIEAVADRLEFEFIAKQKPHQFVSDRISQSTLRSRGIKHSHTIKNTIVGQLNNNVQIFVGDYVYSRLGRKGSSQSFTSRQTIVVLEYNQRPLPRFALVPRTALHQVGRLWGFPNLTFQGHAEFSKRYWLVGPDEPAIRDCFTPEVLTFFENNEGCSVEALDSVLLYYKAGHSIQAKQWETLIKTVSQIYQQLQPK